MARSKSKSAPPKVAARIVAVRMTMTTPGCAAQGFIVNGVEQRLAREDGITGVFVDVEWDPPQEHTSALAEAEKAKQACRLAAQGYSAVRHCHTREAERLNSVLYSLMRHPSVASLSETGAVT
jgi:metal-sulfur cluster biosynthetic enzyme